MAVRGACVDDGDAGDAGLQWDGSSGYLYLTDLLPNDDAEKGELAFFRAPGSFLGDAFAAFYGGVLTYELYVAGGGDARRNAGPPPTAPHVPGSPEAETPDAYLIGGVPRVGLEIPPWDAWTKTRALEWTRARFPELAVDARWSKSRLVATVEAYLDTPQIFLGIRAPRQRHYPPEVCLEEHCSLNFAFDIREGAGWRNYPAVRSGFGWFGSGADADSYPEVYDAIRANRESRDYSNATFAEMARCFSSLTELLLRADYYGSPTTATDARGFVRGLASGRRASGVGETVRLDHVFVVRNDEK
jgi:hypothetical protein